MSSSSAGPTCILSLLAVVSAGCAPPFHPSFGEIESSTETGGDLESSTSDDPTGTEPETADDAPTTDAPTTKKK